MQRMMGLLGFILLWVSSGLAIVDAQAVRWEAWLYSGDNNHMLRVGSDGNIYQDVLLPGLQGNTFGENVVVSPDGRIVIYSLYNSNNGIVTMYAYDLFSEQVLATYIIPSQQGDYTYTSLELGASKAMFTPDSSAIAFGYLIEDDWSIVVMDLVNIPGRILFQLNKANPIMSGEQSSLLLMPYVNQFDGFVLDFNLIPFATEGMPAYDHYQYDMRTNSVSQQSYFRIPWGDFNPRNESYVFPISDFRYSPADGVHQIWGAHTNSLHLHQAGTNTSVPIYFSPNKELRQPHFVQNGEKILFQAYDLVNQSRSWAMIQDHGMGQIQLYPLARLGDFRPSSIESTENGMVMTVNTSLVVDTFPELSVHPNRTALMSFDTRNDNLLNNGGTTIWLSDENIYYKLVQVIDNQADNRAVPSLFSPQGDAIDITNFDDLMTFEDEAVSANGLNPLQRGTPSGSNPPANSAITIGGQASIFTTGGDRANMRNLPSLRGNVVDRLANGTVVDILNGPTNGDGYVWWQVQSGINVGWVVESADGIRVLQPYGALVPVAVPTATLAPAPRNLTLFVGGTVVVTEEGNSLNAREDASVASPVVAVFRTGDSFNIIGGPIENDGFVWWQINTAFGVAWVAEGTARETWIIGVNG
jgi:hypothetical protein